MCVTRLKQLLPLVRVPELKKMHTKATGIAAPEDKDELMEQIVGYLLPTYPYHHPNGSASEAEEGEEEGENDGA